MNPAKFVVVGGGGYIGFHIGLTLWDRGHTVALFDISHPDSFWLENAKLLYKPLSNEDRDTFLKTYYLGNAESHMKLVNGSILDLKSLRAVIIGVDCVIHCASYGMSGPEQMPAQWTKTEEINITGIENVLKVCLDEGVSSLVYTSSYNVIFGTQEIKNGNESLPYFPLHKHVDHYSRTKAIAERLVLYSNGLHKNADGFSIDGNRKPLHTCSLRLAGVFGLGERRHLPRIVDLLGLFLFTYGQGDSLQQFCTLRNVVQAHVKAAEQIQLTPGRLGGQAYFISDGVPINTFEFVRPLREALGYRQPSVKIPMWILWLFVHSSMFLHSFLAHIHPSLSFTPVLAPAEVFKSGVTHYFSNCKAQEHFGYVPETPNDITDVVQHYVDKKNTEKRKQIGIFSWNALPLLLLISALILTLPYLLH